MKVLHVYGDFDYAVLTLQGDVKVSNEEAYAKAEAEEDGVWEFAEGYYAEAFEFPGTVSKEFIEFINAEKDYDSTKHSDWFVIEGAV